MIVMLFFYIHQGTYKTVIRLNELLFIEAFLDHYSCVNYSHIIGKI